MTTPKNDVVVAEQAIVVHESVSPSPMAMIADAVAKGCDVAVLEKLLELEERWRSGQARRAFDAALADAKAEIPTIEKDRIVDYAGKGGRVSYRHEDLVGIARAIDGVLARHGLSYRYRTEQSGHTVTVTCILSHREGASEETTLACPVDTSGNKNPIQAIGSAVTYLQRYTLKAALGLSAGVDDDARATASAPKTAGKWGAKAADSDAVSREAENLARHLAKRANALGIDATQVASNALGEPYVRGHSYSESDWRLISEALGKAVRQRDHVAGEMEVEP